jgi:hypothetical protein
MTYPLRVVHDLRPVLPWTIYSLPVSIEQGSPPVVHEQRFAVQWDEDNDERVLAAVLDVFFRHPPAVESLYAVAESKGSLTIWASTFPTADQHAWAAASAGPAVLDHWPVRTITLHQETRITGGRRSMLSEGEVVRKFEPEHDQLNWLVKLFELGPTGPRLPW